LQDGVATGVDCFLDKDTLVGHVWDNPIHRSDVIFTNISAHRVTLKIAIDDKMFRHHDIVVSPDGSRVAVAGENFWLLDPRTGSVIKEIGPVESSASKYSQVNTRRMQFCCGGKVLMLIDAALKTSWIDSQTGDTLPRRQFQTKRGATVSADGDLIAISNDTVEFYDVASGRLLNQDGLPKLSVPGVREPGSSAVFLSFSPTGKTLGILLTPPEPRLVLWDLSTLPGNRRTIPSKVLFYPEIAWSNDGTCVAVTSMAQQPELLQVSTGERLCAASTHLTRLAAIAITPDGAALFTADHTGIIARWNVSTGEGQVMREQDPLDPIMPISMQFVEDGRTLLMADARGQVQICDAITLQCRHKIAGHAAPSSVAAFSPDGRLVAQFHSRDFAQVWQLSSGQDVRQIPDTSHGTSTLAFSNDSRTLATCGAGVLKLVDLASGNIQTVKCNIAGGFQTQSSFSPDDRLIGVVEFNKADVWNLGAVANGSDQPLLQIQLPLESAKVFSGAMQFCRFGGILAVGETLQAADSPHKYSVSLFEPETSSVIASIEGVPDLMWDLRTALKDDSQGHETDDALWAKLSASDAGIAYRAGLILDQRKGLATLARSLKPLPDDALFEKWVNDLSSDQKAVRESAHKHLEAAGSAAARAERRAADLHPGGEVEQRLADLLRLIDAAAPGPANNGIPSADELRTRRVLQILDWSEDPAATSVVSKLTGQS
jgi:WD40 repeat protein